MTRKLRRFKELPVREKLLFLEAFLLHLFVGLLLKVIPFRCIPGLFASRQFETQTEEEDQSRTRSVGTAVASPQSEIIENIGVAVRQAGSVSPWKNRCLVSSLAGRCMLRRRKIDSQISLGMAKNANGKMMAHAWLVSGDVEIVPSGGSFRELYKF